MPPFVYEPQNVDELLVVVKAFLATHPTNTPVPRIIHQVWHNPPGQHLPIPKKWEEGVENWNRHHPEWLHILWRTEVSAEFVQRFEGWFYPTYQNYTYLIQRADAIRYCFLKHIGGVYADLDWNPQADIEPHFGGDCPVYLVPSYTNGCYTNCFLASKPGCELWDLVLKRAAQPKKWWQFTQFAEVMFSTGPSALTEAVKGYNGTVGRLPYAKFNPVNFDQVAAGITTKEGALVKFSRGASWHTLDTAILALFYENWPLFVPIVMLLVILVVVWVGYHYRIGRRVVSGRS